MTATPTPPADTVDLNDEAGLARWAERFGCNTDTLREAVQAVGSSPTAVEEHLLNQGGSAGAS